MVIRTSTAVSAETQSHLEAAILRYGESGNVEDQLEAIRLYEIASRHKAGCGVCQAGRTLFIKGLADIASGNGSDGLAKFKGALRSVTLKLDILRGKK